jgi:hypothetical protein
VPTVAESEGRSWFSRLPFFRRFAWFNFYMAQLNVYADEQPDPEHFYTCPCCAHPTLGARGTYEICDVCDWEDDGQDDHDSWVVRGGPNGSLSLDEARARFVASGGVIGAHVPPTEPR